MMGREVEKPSVLYDLLWPVAKRNVYGAESSARVVEAVDRAPANPRVFPFFVCFFLITNFSTLQRMLFLVTGHLRNYRNMLEN
jgi:hypothetical protein